MRTATDVVVPGQCAAGAADVLTHGKGADQRAAPESKAEAFADIVLFAVAGPGDIDALDADSLADGFSRPTSVRSRVLPEPNRRMTTSKTAGADIEGDAVQNLASAVTHAQIGDGDDRRAGGSGHGQELPRAR
jgi:hypothetical protein